MAIGYWLSAVRYPLSAIREWHVGGQVNESSSHCEGAKRPKQPPYPAGRPLRRCAVRDDGRGARGMSVAVD
jgi:hypothetical protein